MPVAVKEGSEEKESGIVETEGTLGGVPRIKGTRVRVSDIAVRYKAGEEPEEISRLSSRLDLGDVHAALSYYLNHREEIEGEIKEREEELKEAKRKEK